MFEDMKKNLVEEFTKKFERFDKIQHFVAYLSGQAASIDKNNTTRNNPYKFNTDSYWCWQEGFLGN